MNFGRKLKELRKKNRWSQKELAEKAGLHHLMISKYENNSRIPNADTVVKIAKALDTSVDHLIMEDHPSIDQPINDQELLQLCQRIDAMDGENRHIIKTVMKAFVKQNLG